MTATLDISEQYEDRSMDEYKFIQPGEKSKEWLATLAGIGVLSIGLPQIFNPVALGLAVGYGVLRTGQEFYNSYVGNPYDRATKKGLISDLPSDYQSIQDYVDYLTDNLGIDKHCVAIGSDDFVRSQLPEKYWLAKLLRFLSEDLDPAKSARMNFIGVDSKSNIIITTEEFLNSMSEKGIEFALAHEIAHGKTNDTDGIDYAITHIAKRSLAALTVGFYGALAASAVGLASITAVTTFSASLSAIGLGYAGLWVTSKLANQAFNYASRIKEYRADRNALYQTRDLESAKNTIIDLNLAYFASDEPPAIETQTHPSTIRRIAGLKDAHAHVSAYPPLPENESVSVKLPEHTEKTNRKDLVSMIALLGLGR